MSMEYAKIPPISGIVPEGAAAAALDGAAVGSVFRCAGTPGFKRRLYAIRCTFARLHLMHYASSFTRNTLRMLF